MNFGAKALDIVLEDVYQVEIASDGSHESEPFSGALAAEQAVLLRPTSKADS